MVETSWENCLFLLMLSYSISIFSRFTIIFLHQKWNGTRYHQQIKNVRVTSRVAERPKTYKIRKLQGNTWNTWPWQQVSSRPPKSQILTRFLVKWFLKSLVKHSTEKSILLSFLNLSTTICPRLSEKADFNF